LLRRGIGLLPDGNPRRLDALPEYIRAVSESGGWGDARAGVDELLAADDERAHTYGALFAQELAFISSDGFEDVEPAFAATGKEAQETFERLGDVKGLAFALRIRAYERWVACRADEAAAGFEAAADHARRANLPIIEEECISLFAASISYGPTPALQTISRLDQLAEKYADRLLIGATILSAVGRLRAARGEFELARRLLAERTRIYVEAGLVVAAAASESGMGVVEWCAGDLAGEERVLRESFARLSELGDRGYRSTVAMYLSRCLADQGRDDEARTWLGSARDLTDAGDAVNVVGLDSTEAVLLARSGDLRDAERLSRRALAGAEQTDYVSIRELTRMQVAEVLERVGQVDEARRMLEEALAIAHDHGDLAIEERVQELLAAFDARRDRQVWKGEQ
jgi:tetratricopeptide (TPR) repeat protein